MGKQFMLTQEQILDILRRLGVFLEHDHFVYTRRLHGTAYVNKDALWARPLWTSIFSKFMAYPFTQHEIEAVVGPEKGGIVLSQWVAYHLTKLRGLKQGEVLALYAEKNKTGDGFYFGRDYDSLVRGKRVLVVEDVINTGESVSRVIEAVRREGATVVGLSALWNRGSVAPQLFADMQEFSALVTLGLDAWPEEYCREHGPCAQARPINMAFGKGREFVLGHP